MDIDPQSSQKDHIVLRPLGPAAQAIRSLGIWEQFVLSVPIQNNQRNILLRENGVGQYFRDKSSWLWVSNLPVVRE